MKKLLALFTALALAATVQVSTAPPSQASTMHTIHHFSGYRSPAYMLVGNGTGQIYWLASNTSRPYVHRAFIPTGCTAHEVVAVAPGIYSVSRRFGSGPKWAELSGHTHPSRTGNSVHNVKVTC